MKKRRPVYTLVGDEVYFRDRFRAELTAELPEEGREFACFDLDLSTTPLDEVLDQARSPSLMAPVQLFFVRNAKEMFGRGEKKHGDFPANLERLAAQAGDPPAAIVVFIADHLHLPADRARMGLEDKGRLQRIEATLGKCGELVYCGRVSETQAAALAQEMVAKHGLELAPELARGLAERLEADLGRIRTEIEKLVAYTWPERRIAAEAVDALTAGAPLASGFELALAVARGEAAGGRAACLQTLDRVWRAEGDGGAIGLVFQLSRAIKMALVARQERVRDRSRLYQVLPEGLRPPGFAADTVLAIARAMSEARMRRGLRLLHAADVDLRSSPPSMRLVFERLVLALT